MTEPATDYYPVGNTSPTLFSSEGDNVSLQILDILGENETYQTTPWSNWSVLSGGNGSEAADGQHPELYQVPLVVIIVLSILYGGICVAALVGNCLVLWIIIASRSMRTVTNFFIANLALADIIIGMFTVPFQFQAALLQRWNLPHFLCAFCPFIQVLSVTVSVFTLSAIALDRYRAVMRPLQAKSSKSTAVWLILSIWLVAFVIALPTELDYNVILIKETRGTKKAFCANTWLSPVFRIYYNQSVVIMQYFFPLFILTGAYMRMGSELWRTQPPGNSEETRDAVVLRNKIKVIKMLYLVVIMFAVCWFPLQTYNFLQTIFPSINAFQYINVLWFSVHWLAMSNSCVNPFIYAIYNEKFQKEFRSRLPCISRRSTQFSSSSILQDMSEPKQSNASSATQTISTIRL